MKASLEELSAELHGKRVLVLPHSNADPDALGSALAMCMSLEDARLGIPDGVNRASKTMLSSLPKEISDKIVVSPDEAREFQWILCVDTSAPPMLGPFAFLADRERGVMVIDHHSETDEWTHAMYHTNEDKGSCAEIIYDVLQMMNVPICRDAALFLMAGIYSDTVSLKYATISGLRAFVNLAELHELIPEDAASIISYEQKDTSERISHVKAAQRIKMLRVGKMILLSSRISAFESSTARMLLGIGGDVAFVGSQDKKNVRVSARARRPVIDAGIHMGTILEEVAEEIGGSGGGHDGAAGLNTKGDVEAVLHVCMEKAAEKMRKAGMG